MWKKGWILLLVLLCVAFLISCGRNERKENEVGELVHLGTVGENSTVFFTLQL